MGRFLKFSILLWGVDLSYSQIPAIIIIIIIIIFNTVSTMEKRTEQDQKCKKFVKY